MATMSMGAKVVEKHFTINNKLPGRDNLNAILPNEMSKLRILKIYLKKCP